MNNDHIKFFFELLEDDDYCLLYNGNFVDTVTSKIINIAKVSLIQRGELIKTQNRFAYLIAESFQNIIRHGGHKEHKDSDEPLPGFFMTKIRGQLYNIITGNHVHNHRITEIKDKIDAVNRLTNEELKELYKKVISEGELSEKGGAGLGLIDMAKKSSQKIEYQFLNDVDNKSLFYNQVVMNSDSKIKDSKELKNGLAFGIGIHEEMKKRDILLLQKSDFSKDSVLPMFKIVEKNIFSKSASPEKVKEIYHVLIELLQNISKRGLKYAKRKEGIFLISRLSNEYQICLGNYIDMRKVEGLKRFVKRISDLNSEELEHFYLKRIENHMDTSVSTLEKDVLDIGTLLSEKFDYSFHEVDADSSFFSIHATV